MKYDIIVLAALVELDIDNLICFVKRLFSVDFQTPI